ncbi:membrane protein [Bacillus coahuilensis p1.1.43]|uniref:Membrane protein n=1 Tax=Bacillus coahuilensis p1.1.43 TaxID=1150625 RepID=A0A147K404_9BACI|nr:hypothetical protein [Bacillus coahuilensis]KUP04022.1 membrane protein [Bacillus coahuilensis p1.1.43]
MKEIILFIAEVVNELHDFFIYFTNSLGLELNDKQLHLWIMGIIGIIFFFGVQIVFKWLSNWSITAISFIYTFTVMVVIVFAIEIQQKITNRGNMEFADAVIGLWGFLLFFIAFLIIKGLMVLGIWIVKKVRVRYEGKHLKG